MAYKRAARRIPRRRFFAVNSRLGMRGRPMAKAMAARREVLKVSRIQKLRGRKTKMTIQSTKASTMLGHRPLCDAGFVSCLIILPTRLLSLSA
jgi:hypothetical protein